MQTFIILILVVLSSISFAVEGEKLQESPPPLADSTPVTPGEDPDKYGHSFAPVVGYEPNYRFVVGAAYFYEQRNFSLGLDVNLNFAQVYQFHTRVKHAISEDIHYSWKAGITKGYQPYYGEGGETSTLNASKLWGIIGNSDFRIYHFFNPVLQAGLLFDTRFRSEEPGVDSPVSRVAPDEVTSALGFFQKVDTRDNELNPTRGFAFNTDLRFVPSFFSTSSANTHFAQAEGELLVFQELLPQYIPNWIAAFRIAAGTSFGNPSYAFKYKLGGASRLRGFLENRFRGKYFYHQETELRMPLWGAIGGALFFGVGDTTDDQFTSGKIISGVGLRIGLPPDWVSRVRIDVAFSRDQMGIFADFGNSF